MLSSLKKSIKRMLNPVDLKSLNADSPVDEHMGFSRGTPIDRYFIEKYLSDNSKKIQGNLLEVAEDKYIRQFCTSPENSSFAVLDFSSEVSTPPTKYNFDLEKPETCPEEEFDTFVCTNTLNFLYEVRTAIKASHKILRPGGCFLGTVASYTQVSKFDYERWGDYWRFTDKSLKRLLEEEFKDVEIKVFGNFSTALGLMQGLSVEEIQDKSIFDSVDPTYASVIGFKAIKS